MLALPVVAGWVLRTRATGSASPELVPIAACWVTGYLAFNAATAWLKAPPRRRPSALPPVLVYASVSAVFGVVALVVSGPGLLGWVPAFVPLVAVALWLAARGRDRSVAAGALTVAAAALTTPVARFVTPDAALAALGTDAGTAALALTGIVFGYLFGTVLYVKTMIRERGRPGWLAASIGWHAAVTAATTVLAATGVVGRAWPVFFAATVVRAALVPAIATRRRVTPLAVGLLEIAFTAAFVTCCVLG